MKKLLLSLLILFAAATLSAQEGTDSTVTKKDTSYTIEWGNKTIIVIDNDGKTKTKEVDTIKIDSKPSQRHNHYAGIDFGVNGFLNESNSVDLGEDAKFMDLNYYGSWSVALNFIDSYIPIAKEKFGIVIGAGFEFNKYKLSRDISMVNFKDSTFGVVDSSKSIEKNLFKTEMINVPIMFETNLGKDADHSFHLSVGGMLSYRLGSKVKQIFDQDGEEYKTKSRGEYNLNPFRLNLMGRIGYGNFTVFATYSLTPLFEDDRGPELYPFTVGVSLVHF